MARRNRRDEPNQALTPTLSGRDDLSGLGQPEQHVARHGQQTLTGRRRPHAPRMPVEKVGVDQSLEVCERLGDRRLGQPDRIRSSLDASQLRHLQQHLEMSELPARHKAAQQDSGRVIQDIGQSNT